MKAGAVVVGYAGAAGRADRIVAAAMGDVASQPQSVTAGWPQIVRDTSRPAWTRSTSRTAAGAEAMFGARQVNSGSAAVAASTRAALGC